MNKLRGIVLACVALVMVGGKVMAQDQLQIPTDLLILVYDYKADVRNPEPYAMVAGSAECQKLVCTAFTQKNTFTGYMLTYICGDCAYGDTREEQEVVLLLTRSADKQKQWFLIGGGCRAGGNLEVGTYEKTVGGLANCNWPIAVSKIKSAQVELDFGAGDYGCSTRYCDRDLPALPGFLFGNAIWANIQGNDGCDTNWWGYRPDDNPLFQVNKEGNSGWFHFAHSGFGTIKAAGTEINCNGMSTCRYLDQADGALVGDFEVRTLCCDDDIWTLCSLGNKTEWQVYNPLKGCICPDGTMVAAPEGVNVGVVAGTWSIKINTALTKLQSGELIAEALMRKHKLATLVNWYDAWDFIGPSGYWKYNRLVLVTDECPPCNCSNNP